MTTEQQPLVKHHILRCGERLIAAKGFVGVGLAEILAAAGVVAEDDTAGPAIGLGVGDDRMEERTIRGFAVKLRAAHEVHHVLPTDYCVAFVTMRRSKAQVKSRKRWHNVR